MHLVVLRMLIKLSFFRRTLHIKTQRVQQKRSLPSKRRLTLVTDFMCWISQYPCIISSLFFVNSFNSVFPKRTIANVSAPKSDCLVTCWDTHICYHFNLQAIIPLWSFSNSQFSVFDGRSKKFYVRGLMIFFVCFAISGHCCVKRSSSSISQVTGAGIGNGKKHFRAGKIHYSSTAFVGDKYTYCYRKGSFLDDQDYICK